MTENKEVKSNKKTANKRKVIDTNFVAPDGGWGWFVVVAAGCSNLSTYPVLQQFGLLFRDRLTNLGLSGKEITTIINMNSCITSCLGLINGPIFRKFSYRQVAFVGAVIASLAIFATSFSNSFATYLLTFSILYGAGTGINQSANALALNTYFKEKRRIATGISWTATGLGPIIFPQVIAFLIPRYDVEGTVLIFGCLALCAVGLSLVYQPVEWHTKSKPISDLEDLKRTDSVYAPTETQLCGHCQSHLRRSKPKILSGEYLLNSDNVQFTGYEIIDPGTPMMSKANDGWYSMTPAKRSIYSSRISLTSGFVSRKASFANLGTSGSGKDTRRGEKRSRTEAPVIEDLQLDNLDEFKAEVKSNRTSYSNLFKEGKRDKLKVPKNNESKIEEAEEDCPTLKAPHDVKSGRLRLNIDNLSIPKEIAEQQMELNREHHTYKTQVSTGPPLESPTITFNDWNHSKSKIPTRNPSALSMQNFNPRPRRNPSTNSFHAEKDLLNSVRNQLEEYVSKDGQCTCNQLRLLPKQNNQTDEDDDDDLEDADEEEFTFLQKIFIFFDLDLLKDLTYVNLMIGVTIASFAELNYSILTPFVLADFGLTKTETATSMSLLGAMDISVRFFVPFIAGKIGWENKTFFLFGVLGMALGRISIAHFHTYPAVLAASVWIGLNKGLRTVFMALVIPSHVPLHRLPGATGLQLVFAGMFYFLVGPVIGWIRDTTNYTVTLHCLNIATFTTAICWGLEKLITDWRERRRAAAEAEPLET